MNKKGTQDLYITFEGSIGVGKTTLIEKIKDHFQKDVKIYSEVFSENQMVKYGVSLEEFYKDKSANSLKWQQLVQHHCSNILADLTEDRNLNGPLTNTRARLVLGDRSFEEENVFRAVLYWGKNLKGWEYDICDLTMNAIKTKYPVSPDIRIFRIPSFDEEREHINRRNRKAETEGKDGVDDEYLAYLYLAYAYYISYQVATSDSKIIILGAGWDHDNEDDLKQLTDHISNVWTASNVLGYIPDVLNSLQVFGNVDELKALFFPDTPDLKPLSLFSSLFVTEVSSLMRYGKGGFRGTPSLGTFLKNLKVKEEDVKILTKLI